MQPATGHRSMRRWMRIATVAAQRQRLFCNLWRGFSWFSDSHLHIFASCGFVCGLSIHLPKSETRPAKNHTVRNHCSILCSNLFLMFVLFYFTIIESLMLHVFASVCGMELTRQMSLISMKRKLTMRLREGSLVNYARTIRYQCGIVCLWFCVDTILSSQVGLKADCPTWVVPLFQSLFAGNDSIYRNFLRRNDRCWWESDRYCKALSGNAMKCPQSSDAEFTTMQIRAHALLESIHIRSFLRGTTIAGRTSSCRCCMRRSSGRTKPWRGEPCHRNLEHTLHELCGGLLLSMHGDQLFSIISFMSLLIICCSWRADAK